MNVQQKRRTGLFAKVGNPAHFVERKLNSPALRFAISALRRLTPCAGSCFSAARENPGLRVR